MEILNYSSNHAELNRARVELWCAKEVLAEANRTKDNEMKGRAMAYINKDRCALRNIAHRIRSEQLARYESFKVTITGEATETSVFIKAINRSHALDRAQRDYKGFNVCIAD